MNKIVFIAALVSLTIIDPATAHIQYPNSLIRLIVQMDVQEKAKLEAFFDRNIDRNFAQKFERRIHQSFGYGDISKRGARKLMKALDWYRTEKAKAMRNGKVSDREYRKLFKIQNKLNEDFYKFSKQRPVKNPKTQTECKTAEK